MWAGVGGGAWVIASGKYTVYETRPGHSDRKLCLVVEFDCLSIMAYPKKKTNPESKFNPAKLGTLIFDLTRYSIQYNV